MEEKIRKKCRVLHEENRFPRLSICVRTKRIRLKSEKRDDGLITVSFFSERWPGEYELDGSGSYVTKGTANNRDHRVRMTGIADDFEVLIREHWFNPSDASSLEPFDFGN